jgi:hypothetical protein
VIGRQGHKFLVSGKWGYWISYSFQKSLLLRQNVRTGGDDLTAGK